MISDKRELAGLRVYVSPSVDRIECCSTDVYRPVGEVGIDESFIITEYCRVGKDIVGMEVGEHR